MRTLRKRLKQTATRWLALPPDSLLDVSRVTCVDGKTVIIENVASLLCVEQEQVAVSLGDVTLRLVGSDFSVSLLAEREVHVHGEIREIIYERQGGAGS